MNFYKHHLGDYMKRTQFFSMAQHGAYRLMIDYCYINEGPLPKNKAMIYEICKAATKTNKQDVDAVLEAKWELQDDGYHNDRIDEELETYREKADKNKANGNRGGRPKKTQSVSEIEPKPNPTETLASNQNPITNNHIKTNARKARSVSLPENFGNPFSPAMQEWLEKRGETQVKAHLLYFTGYAKAHGKQYVDWDQAFQNAIRDDWAGVRKISP